MKTKNKKMKEEFFSAEFHCFICRKNFVKNFLKGTIIGYHYSHKYYFSEEGESVSRIECPKCGASDEIMPMLPAINFNGGEEKG